MKVETVFLDSLRNARLIEAKALDSYIDRLAQDGQWPQDALGQARKMLAQGRITKYQAEQLLQGKWRNFQVGGKFNVLERLSGGAMSTVFLCEHIVMKRMVTLKFLPEQNTEDSVLARFHREARAAARLRHPNVAAIYDVDCVGKLHFLVAEYVDGSNLDHVVNVTGPMTVERAANYICQAAQGLQHAHEMGMVHRDIKPSNFLLDRSGTVKLLDLGLARLFQDETDGMTQLENGQMLLGTIDYLAPEQAMDSHDVDIRADIYGLGATFFFLLTGRTLFEGASTVQKLAMHNHRPAKTSVDEIAGIPKALGKVIEKMLAKNRENRYQSPEEVVEALAPFVEGPIEVPSAEEMPKLCLATRRAIEHSKTGSNRPSAGESMDRNGQKSPPRSVASPSKIVRQSGSLARPVSRSSSMARLQARSGSSGVRSVITLVQTTPKVWLGIGTGVAAVAAIGMIFWWLGGDPARATAASPGRIPNVSQPFQGQVYSPVASSGSGDFYKDAITKLRNHEEAEAASLLHRHMKTNNERDSLRLMGVAILDLYLGNMEDYRRDSQAMLDDFGQGNNTWDIERAVKCCMLSRTPVSMEKAKAITQRVLEPASSNVWFKIAVGMVAIRSGELDDALTLLEEGRSLVDPNHPASLCLIEALASIAHARLGHTAEARDALELSRKVFQNATQGGRDYFAKDAWHDWYNALIFYQEAESLLQTTAK